MPMYYPDLASVKTTALAMQEHPQDSKKYKGIVPETDSDLPEARKQLGKYFRDIWKDEIAALEIELAVTRESYQDKLTECILKRFV